MNISVVTLFATFLLAMVDMGGFMSSLNLPVGSAADVLTRLLRRFFLFLFFISYSFSFLSFSSCFALMACVLPRPRRVGLSLSPPFLVHFCRRSSDLGLPSTKFWGYRSQSMLVCCFLNMIVFRKANQLIVQAWNNKFYARLSAGAYHVFF